jgi:prepilin-type processing-associated H-X9-DG protein
VGAYWDSNSLCDAIGAFHNAPNGDPTQGKGNVAFADGHVKLVDSRDSKEFLTPACYK